MAELVVRLATSDDEAQVLALHRQVFQHTPSQAGWRHWRLANPAGPAVTVVAEMAGRIVGHYAHVPARMAHAGRELKATRGVDLVVAPEARGARLSGRLYLMAVEHTRSQMDFHYSTPNGSAAHVLLPLGGVAVVGPTPPVELRLNPAYPLRGKPRWRPVTGLARALGRAWARATAQPAGAAPVMTLTTFDDNCDRLWAEAGHRYGLTLWRDARYLNWRYARPELLRLAVTSDGRLAGWLVADVWAEAGWRGGRVIDLAARDAAAAERLLRAALAEFGRRGADVAQAWMMPHAPDWPVMRRLGFRQRPAGVNLLVRHYPHGRLPLEVLSRRESWHLTLADTDGV